MVLTAAALLGGLVVGLVYAPRDGVLMALFMLACGTPVIVGAHVLVARRRSGGTLGRQFASVAALAIGLVMTGVLVVALLMFISPHDALVMAVLLLFAGGLTAYTTWLLSRDVIAQRDSAETARRDLVAAVSHDLRTPLTSLRLLSDAIEDDLVDERDPAPLRRADVRPHPLALEPDRGPVRALAPGGGRHPLVAGAGAHRRAGRGYGRGHARPGRRRPGRGAGGRARRPRSGRGESREAPARALQPDPERHPPHPGRRERDRAGRIERAHGRGGGGRHRRRACRRASASAPSSPSTAGGSGAARSGDGTGLGLTICRAIVEAHGGEIWFADADRGTRVRFSLPRAASSR